MNLQVERQTFTTFSTTGELFIDGAHVCFTLEPPFRTDDVKPRAIPLGTYKLVKRMSVKHGCEVPGVENVPGFEDIEIHWGNFPRDTEGCLLVGNTKGPNFDFIGGSKNAFAALWAKLLPVWERGEEITITYKNKATIQEMLNVCPTCTHRWVAPVNEEGIPIPPECPNCGQKMEAAV